MVKASYRGYLITETIHGFHVSKNGYHITTQSTLAAAKQQVDWLV